MTGLFTASRMISQRRAQLVTLCHSIPSAVSIGAMIATATLHQNTGFLNLTFQLIFIKSSFIHVRLKIQVLFYFADGLGDRAVTALLLKPL